MPRPRCTGAETGFFSSSGIFGSALKKYGSAFSQFVPRWSRQCRGHRSCRKPCSCRCARRWSILAARHTSKCSRALPEWFPEPAKESTRRLQDIRTRCSALEASSGRKRCDASFVHDSGGGHLAGRFPIEQILGIHAVQQESIAGIALAIGPDRLIPESGIRARCRLEVPHSRRGKGAPRPVKEPVGSGTRIDFLLVHYISVRRIDHVDQRRFFHRYGLLTLPIFKSAFTVAVRFACTRMDGMFWD